MTDLIGVQMAVHPRFLDFCKKVEGERVARGKERVRELSHRRLTLTLVKLFEFDPKLFELICEAEIPKHEL